MPASIIHGLGARAAVRPSLLSDSSAVSMVLLYGRALRRRLGKDCRLSIVDK